MCFPREASESSVEQREVTLFGHNEKPATALLLLFLWLHFFLSLMVIFLKSEVNHYLFINVLTYSQRNVLF